MFTFSLFSYLIPLFQGAIACSWHPKLDQILVGLSDGTCRIYYDPRSSVRGALLCATRPVKRVRTNEVVKEEMIIARMFLVIFSDNIKLVFSFIS